MRVAQYLRMSTEHQTYSLTYQSACNAAYATEHGHTLVREYVDAGVSGLSLKGRAGLRDLLADVMAGAADFEAVLVYDVSRWGRFQDPDEAAHYEFLCRAAGVVVLYTAEPFVAEGGLASAIVKQLRRAMAAEYSRDLSDRVGLVKRSLQAEGYWQGGPPGYGLRRVALRPTGEPHGVLEAGQQKALRGYRTVLVAGPPEEVAIVRRIYRDFVSGLRPAAIAKALNAEGVVAEAGAPWSTHRVRQVLRDEKYAGVLVGRKAAYRFGVRRNRRRKDWIRIPGALPPLVSRALFDAVQAQFRDIKPSGVPDEELLDELRRVLADRGRLSAQIINAHPQAHCADIYRRRFGGLVGAYRRLGIQPTGKQAAAADRAQSHQPWLYRASPIAIDPDEAWRKLEAHYATRGHLSSASIADDPDLPSVEYYRRHFGPMGEIYRRLGHTPTPAQRRSLERQPRRQW